MTFCPFRSVSLKVHITTCVIRQSVRFAVTVILRKIFDQKKKNQLLYTYLRHTGLILCNSFRFLITSFPFPTISPLMCINIYFIQGGPFNARHTLFRKRFINIDENMFLHNFKSFKNQIFFYYFILILNPTYIYNSFFLGALSIFAFKIRSLQLRI